MAAPEIIYASELLVTLIQAYMLAAKQQGLTVEQAKETFISVHPIFMEKSKEPVPPVKEG